MTHDAEREPQGITIAFTFSDAHPGSKAGSPRSSADDEVLQLSAA